NLREYGRRQRMSTLMNLDILLIRSIVSPDLIINYAYTRKEEIEKHRVLLGLNKISLIRLIMEKSWKLTIG
ncbi:MAG TPA: hypothetical protein VFR94_19530, partial [Nitrososphaeraceae archaeon]|nr:hypothetical protein [Nitrososphaeraceae archaeon]